MLWGRCCAVRRQAPALLQTSSAGSGRRKAAKKQISAAGYLCGQIEDFNSLFSLPIEQENKTVLSLFALS